MMTNTATHEAMIAVSEAARMLGVSADSVRRYSQRGLLPVQMSPLGRLYDPADVARLVRERAADADRLTAA